MPQIQPRIQQFLDGDSFKDEFAHTILHNQDVFEEFRRAQIATKEKVTKEKNEAAEAQKKMKEMELNNKYKPPQTYMEQQQNDPAFFNYQYQKY